MKKVRVVIGNALVKGRSFALRAGVMGVVLSPAFAHADGIDTTTVVAAIVAAGAAVALIGAAVVGGPIVIRATYKWIKGAVS